MPKTSSTTTAGTGGAAIKPAPDRVRKNASDAKRKAASSRAENRAAQPASPTLADAHVDGPTPPRRKAGRPRREVAGQAPNTGGPALDRARILEAALVLIDRHGPQAFNIRELAQMLRVFPSAIYWYVPSRNDLVSGAVALAMNGVADDLGAGRWQDRLRALLHRYRDVLRRHPKLAPLVASELIYNAAFDATLLDHLVQLLEDAGFAGPDLIDAYNVVFAAMCGFATMELSTAPPDDGEAWEAACRTQIAGIDSARQPALARHADAMQNRAFVLRWSSGSSRPLDSGFEAWVDVIVRGVESRARALRRAASAPASAG
ncbi:MAG: TetR/AcrR family transcriptional regulator [Polaromonas sp.]|nr:TetR/AcrR family transcriptional regulator [Polaromonas sp.]